LQEFAFSGPSGGNDPNLAQIIVQLHECVNNDECSTSLIEPDRYPSLFGLAVLFVGDRNRIGIPENAAGPG
jgi:hypothetical protein